MRSVICVVALLLSMGISAGYAQNAKPNAPDPKSGCGGGRESIMREYPLLEAPQYTNTRCAYVEMRVIINDYGGTMKVVVPINVITVELRRDGKAHTSLQYWADATIGDNAEKAVLLVPVQEDAAAWLAEVENWKKARQEYLDSLPKPHRILPQQK